MQTAHVATVNAFENKSGSWTGVICNEITREVIRKRFSTKYEARNWVRIKAWDMFGPISFAEIRRKNEYCANCLK